MARKSIILCLLALLLFPLSQAQALDSANIASFFTGFKVQGLHYLSYEAKDAAGITTNKFAVNRSYLTAQKTINDLISSRITLDAHQDSTGDVKVRVKYAYAKFNLEDWGDVFTDTSFEFGIAHTPWLDFEQHINLYRMQGKMAVERAKLFNSADFGLTFNALLGGEINEDYQKSVSKAYPGKYGSFAMGVYNGGGYHAEEVNENKVIQGRLTIRPLPYSLPGMQASYFGLFGDCNLPAEANGTTPDWQVQTGMLSYEAAQFVVTGQYFQAMGNQSGSYTGIGYSTRTSGFSGFCELRPGDHWRVIGRVDQFDPNSNSNFENDTQLTYIVGAGYDFGKQNTLLLDYERLTFENDDLDPNNAIKITMQIKY